MNNPFELLGQDENEDPQELVAAVATKKSAGEEKPAKQAPKSNKAGSQAPARSSGAQRNDRGRGRGRYGGDRQGYSGEGNGDELTYDNQRGNRGGSRPGNRDRGGRGGYNGGEDGHRRPKREFDRHSGTGRGMEVKKGGAGRGNWGKETDNGAPETPKAEGDGADATVDDNVDGEDAKAEEEEDKEMTLEEYEKQIAEKKLAMLNLVGKKEKADEASADTKEFDGMEEVGKKGDADEIFLRVGEARKKDIKAKSEARKQTLETNFKAGGEQQRMERDTRGGFRGRGGRDTRRGGDRGAARGRRAAAPRIDDDSAFPGLGS